jgi:hypothetical protein
VKGIARVLQSGVVAGGEGAGRGGGRGGEVARDGEQLPRRWTSRSPEQ